MILDLTPVSLNFSKQMDDKGNQPLSVLLRNPSWNMRKEGYERLLYSLKSGSR